MAAEEPPKSIEVPGSALGQIIGRGGSVIKRLIQATGCEIEVPKGKKPDDDEDDKPVTIHLKGSAEQRRLAAAAIRDVQDGGEAEDYAARAEGAMVVNHKLEHRERESWLNWRLTAFEKICGVRFEVGRRAVRVWADKRGGLSGAAAEKVKKTIDTAIEQACELSELEVECQMSTDPENAHFDAAVGPLVDQHGVLIHVPRPEDGVVKVRVVGPTEPARDAAMLIEAKYVKGKSTASVLQCSGQIQGMPEGMANDWANDIREMEAEYSVKVKESAHVIWLAGDNAEGVENARRALVGMLPFYMADCFFMLEDLPQTIVNELKQDSIIRGLMARPECAIAFDRIQGTAWICGTLREAVKKRISEMVGKYEAEHWEQDLEHYGVAMWLLGPQGSGQWMQRMITESGAKIKVCPNALKVWVEGKPQQLEDGKKLVLGALEQLEAKQKADEASGGRTVKAKEILSEQPPHMRAIMEKLAMLEAMKRGGRPPIELLRERGLVRDRSRSRSREPEQAPENVESHNVMEWNPATGAIEATAVDVDMGAAAASAPEPAAEEEQLTPAQRRMRAIQAAQARADGAA